MDSVSTASELRRVIRDWRRQDNRVAFVPTMGNLHAGHLQLVQHARAIADRVVVSIFVNPTQFGPNEDYAAYPRTLDEDTRALADADADLLFVPAVEEIYPPDLAAAPYVEVPEIGDILCGEFRPGHFSGVATVVAKLFSLVQPDVAVFGEKDYQQLVVIRRMTRALCLPVAIEGVATVREASGLAMSSRNRYLSEAERATAAALYRVLEEVRATVEGGACDYAALEAAAMAQLAQAGFRPEYVSIRRTVDLTEPRSGDTRLRVLAAAWLGQARLIDNVSISIS
jgi:pantoate--beta-alanine ligase